MKRTIHENFRVVMSDVTYTYQGAASTCALSASVHQVTADCPRVIVRLDDWAIGGDQVTAWLTFSDARRLADALGSRGRFEFTDPGEDTLTVEHDTRQTTITARSARTVDGEPSVVSVVMPAGDVSALAAALRAMAGGEHRGRRGKNARAEHSAIPPLWIAEYEGAEPTLHLSREAAIAACDEHAKADARGRCFDWRTEDDGVERQFWTRGLDDAPVSYTGGAVWQIAVEAGEKSTRKGDATHRPAGTGGAT